MKRFRPWLFGLCIAVACATQAADYPLPSDAPSFDVTKPPFGAIGDGKTDCTAAINAALAAAQKTGGLKLVYVPNGTYLVSDTITWRGRKKIILQGQSRERTIIRLKDSCPGFDDPAAPKFLVDAGKAGSNDFYNSLHHLTIDIGAGNPGATGLKFHTSNQGAVTDVLIRSSDTARRGVVGLELTANGPGPGLIRGVRIEGFEVGISMMREPGFTMTFEHIGLKGQRQAGLVTENLSVSVRGLTSENSVPAVRVLKSRGMVALVDADLRTPNPAIAPPVPAAATNVTASASPVATNDASEQREAQTSPPMPGEAQAASEASLPAPNQPRISLTAAIENLDSGALFVRNTKVEGYDLAIHSTVGSTTQSVPGPVVDEYTSHPVRSVLPDAGTRSLALPIEDAPEGPWGDPAQWVSVKSFEPRTITYTKPSGRKETVTDWSEAVQKAIDSGKEVVYFPNDAYTFTETIHVRGKVKRILCMDSRIAGVKLPDSPARPLFRIEDGDGDYVIIERFIGGGDLGGPFWEHATKRSLVLRHGGSGEYANTVQGGKVFIEDFMIAESLFDRQKVWMRQWNCEAKGGADSFNTVNKGGDMWILGVKTEGPKTVVTTTDGGRTELLGGEVYPNRGTEGQPAFVCEDGQQSLVYAVENGWVGANAQYEEQVRETRGGRTQSLWRADVFKRGGTNQEWGGVFVPLYVGYTRKEVPRPVLRGAPLPLTPEVFARGGLGRTGQFEGKGLAKPQGLKWKFNAPGGTKDPLYADGIVYFGDARGNFYAVRAADGAQQWKFDRGQGVTGPPAIACGKVFFGSGDSLIALDVATGCERWRLRTGGTTAYAPAVVSAGDRAGTGGLVGSDATVVFASGDGTLYAADADRGAVKWRMALPYAPASDVAAAGGLVYLGMRRGVIAVNSGTGEKEWFFETGGGVTQPIVADGTVYVAAEALWALDATTGMQKWKTNVFPNTESRMCLAGGKLYVGSPRVFGIHVLDARTGDWTDLIKYQYYRNWGNQLLYAPVVADGVLYCVMNTSWAIAAVDLKTGKMLWFEMSGFHGSPTVGEGMVFAGTGGGLVALH